MLARIKAWYLAAVAWLGVSEPGTRKEQVEDALTEGRLKDIIERQIAIVQAGRGRFAQVLRGGVRPSDRTEDFPLGFTIPLWADYEINEWHSPQGKGFELAIFVTEADNTLWRMAFNWNEGGVDFSVDPWKLVEAPHVP